MKRPAFQFYPADWRKDTALQGCSLLARGLWHEMLCLMHECEPYGHLSVNGKPMKPAQVARLVGISEKEYQRLLSELMEAGVPSVSDEGCVFSRRMVRDEHIRNVRAEAGKKGGNPKLVGSKDKQKDNQTDNQSAKQTPTPSSSSSSSTTEKQAEPIGSGADAPRLSPSEALFQVAVPWLVERGVPDKSARSLLGAARKQLGDDGAWALASSCIDASPLDPVPWLTAALKTRIATKPAVRTNSMQSRSDANIQGFLDSFGGHNGAMVIDMEDVR
jgi:hypothetical protein